MTDRKGKTESPSETQEKQLVAVSEEAKNKTINIVFNWNGKNLFQFTASGVTLAAMLYLLKTLFDMVVEWSDHTHRNIPQ